MDLRGIDMNKLSRGLGIASWTMATFAGCTALSLGAPATYAAASPQPGGTLTVALETQAQCIDPQQDNYGYGSADGRQLVDSLTDQSYDDPTHIVPWLARSWEIDKTATSYTFHLRKNVTFSDGTPLNAGVVKQNFETLAKIPGAAGAAYLNGVTSIDTPDPFTIRLVFSAPNVPFLAATSTAELGIVAPKTLSETPDQRCHTGVIGSGPFKIQSVTYNEKAILAKRTGYAWASPLRKHQGDAYLDRVVYQIIPEATVRTGALESHQVDVIQAVSVNDATAIQTAGFPLAKIGYIGTAVNLLINTSRGTLADKQVRLALQHGINRKEVDDLAFNGYLIPATGVLTQKTPDYLDQSAALSYQPDVSRKILDQAGWKPGQDGIRSKNGQRLVITVSFYASPINQSFLEVIQQELLDIGVDLKLRPLTGGAFDAALLAGDYDLHRWQWMLADPDVLRSVYSTKTLNRFRLPADNPIDAPLDAQRATTDPAERQKITAAVQRTIIEEAYALPIFDNVNLWAYNSKVHGISYGAGGTDGPNQILYDAWVAR
jgi:peptide/nickel transport system substrate-binding protein